MLASVALFLVLHTATWHTGYDQGVTFAGIDRMVGVSIQPRVDCTNIQHANTGQGWKGCVTGERDVIRANGNLLR